MVPALCQIDVLDVSGHLTIENSADKEPDGSLKIVLCVDGVVALSSMFMLTQMAAPMVPLTTNVHGLSPTPNPFICPTHCCSRHHRGKRSGL